LDQMQVVPRDIIAKEHQKRKADPVDLNTNNGPSHDWQTDLSIRHMLSGNVLRIT
jgi:hypothetical protein